MGGASTLRKFEELCHRSCRNSGHLGSRVDLVWCFFLTASLPNVLQVGLLCFQKTAQHPQDFATVQHLLRYNDWQHDPLSAHGYEGPKEPNAPENAIAARYDLHPWPQALVL